MVDCVTTAQSRNLAWPSAPLQPRIAEGELHLYAASLAVPDRHLMRYAACLAGEERERASRFYFDLHRKGFIAGRSILRSILGSYLGIEPAAVELVFGPQGKPALAPKHSSPLTFNLSHSEDLALVAISLRAAVGVDVERVRTLHDADSLVERFFSAREHALYSGLEPRQKPAAFFSLWTRKEALLKATGDGIGELLNRVEVSFLKDEAPRFHALPPQFGDLEEWQLNTANPAPGFVGAVAVQGHAQISCWSWPSEAGGFL